MHNDFKIIVHFLIFYSDKIKLGDEMEPIKLKELPIEYSIGKELLKLISEANEKYGEYKSYLKTVEFDSKYFLDSIILSESLKSTQISQDDPVLFLSEVIELYKPSYYKYLNESRMGNIIGFIKFFLQCIIEQCNNYIAKINRIKRIYYKDMKKIGELKSNAVYRIMPALMHQIVFTKKKIEDESGVLRNTVSVIIDQLVEIVILEQDSKHAKLAYRYKEIYDVFVGKEYN